MTFTELLEEKGYKTYRFVAKNNWNKESKKQAQTILDKNANDVIFVKGDFNTDESDFFIPVSFNHTYIRANYNTLLNGGIATYFVKDLDFENPIVFGLHEQGQPPTLISPRPNIKRVNEIINDEGKVLRTNLITDEAVTYVLRNENPELVYKSLFDDSIEFNYI
ncbi:hypothetical protein Phi19:1_gp077 [Cellulophaga phage phi19:1]|uniref:Uncharacterized protein n=1 Tax=Cellulophaga phage phi19:1 TaxID=1327970 RepID=R9ZYE7_9CAUD|nr:hypothetical protein Phi19:1_gp077 [Cellulophaga phage phi19:1]AGO47367.1 hypothetical protein Phi19:1_gp077 [Cellulophaga phage phi19:1]